MSIRVWRRGDLYDVLVVPEWGRGRTYRSAEPLTALEVVARLEALGCHPADVGEAMSAADPVWMAGMTVRAAGTEVELPGALPAGSGRG